MASRVLGVGDRVGVQHLARSNGNASGGLTSLTGDSSSGDSLVEGVQTDLERDRSRLSGDTLVRDSAAEEEIISSDNLYYKETFWRPYDRFCW